MINGREAAKLVYQPTADADVYLIRANGRIYEITPMLAIQPSRLGKSWLDLVASTFVAIPPQEATSASRTGGLQLKPPSAVLAVGSDRCCS